MYPTFIEIFFFSKNLFLFKAFDKLDNLLLYNSKVMNNFNLKLMKKNLIFNSSFNNLEYKRYFYKIENLKKFKKTYID